jgi:hypothetical protein
MKLGMTTQQVRSELDAKAKEGEVVRALKLRNS